MRWELTVLGLCWPLPGAEQILGTYLRACLTQHCSVPAARSLTAQLLVCRALGNSSLLPAAGGPLPQPAGRLAPVFL